MKAKVCNSMRGVEFGLKMDNARIHKQNMDGNEMHDCFMKLKELVPSIPLDKKLSKVQLLQHVIDYIMDLEITLEHQHPTTCHGAILERKPLTETNYFNTMVSIFDFFLLLIL